jgi:hypothetical protein
MTKCGEPNRVVETDAFLSQVAIIGVPAKHRDQRGLCPAKSLPTMNNQLCRLSHECKLGDQTKDDADKEPREERLRPGIVYPRFTPAASSSRPVASFPTGPT